MQGNELYKIWLLIIIGGASGLGVSIFCAYATYKWEEVWKEKFNNFLDNKFRKYID